MRSRTQIIQNAKFVGTGGGQDTSELIELGEMTLTGIAIPTGSVLNGKVITFFTSLSQDLNGQSADYQLADKAGTNYTVTLVQGKVVQIPEEITKMVFNLKLKMSVALGANVSASDAVLLGYNGA